MIEINLLPGARKAKRSKGAGLDIGAAFTNVVAQIKDPFLIVAVAGLVVGLVGVGVQYTLLSRRQSDLDGKMLQAQQDSARYAAIGTQLNAAETQLDSVLRQFNIIQTIDGERFNWPHVLDELSEALPQYTWLTSIAQTSPVPSVVVRDSATGKGAKRIEAAVNAARAAVAPLQFRIIGQTMDVQAITQYWRLLEASPFIEKVNLVGTTMTMADQREVIQFTMDLQFQRPDPSAIRTVPLNVLVR
jgi:Tfp pilus assembly protein PilN